MGVEARRGGGEEAARRRDEEARAACGERAERRDRRDRPAASTLARSRCASALPRSSLDLAIRRQPRGRRVAEEPRRIVVGILGINATQLGAAVIFGRVYLESAEFAFATFAQRSSNGQRRLNINRDDDRVYKQPAFDGPERARARARVHRAFTRRANRWIAKRSIASRYEMRDTVWRATREESSSFSFHATTRRGTKLTVSSAITTTTTTTATTRSRLVLTWSTCFESR